jgi:hypothetical protein
MLKSDHLGVADLEEMQENGQNLIFTIKQARAERGAKVAGKTIDCNIVYFVENIKPLVVNATDWAGVKIELYADENVKMKGEIVGGVRVSPLQPKIKEIDTSKAIEKLKKCQNEQELKDCWIALSDAEKRNTLIIKTKDEKKNEIAQRN